MSSRRSIARQLTWSGAADAAPDFFLAFAYLAVWRAPDLLGDGVATGLLRAARMEFAAIHAAGFLLAPRLLPWKPAQRLLLTLGLAASYMLAVGVMSVVVKDWWPLVTFWGLTANRLLGALFGPRIADPEAQHRISMPWAGEMVLFVIAAGLAGLAGMSEAAICAAAFVYFAATALSALTRWTWVWRWQLGRDP